MHIQTLIYTWLRGKLVGVDEFANRYYKGKRQRRYGREQRWVLYKGRQDPTRIPPEWHAWLHHTCDEPLTEAAAQAPSWQKEHQPNRTGTVAAYRPPGHDLGEGRRQRTIGDYEPWVPE